jgi:peroxidase
VSDFNLNIFLHFAHSLSHLSRSLERQISKKLKIINGSISHAQYIESMPDDGAKEIDSIAQNILKASSYLLNMHCKTKGISNKECVKFMSRYALPASEFTAKCSAMDENAKYYGYRRLLPASYQDGLQQVRMSVLGKELPLPRVISSIFYKSGVENARRIGESKRESVNEEGIIDTSRSLAVAQWAQFLEQDLSKTVARSLCE